MWNPFSKDSPDVTPLPDTDPVPQGQARIVEIEDALSEFNTPQDDSTSERPSID